MKRENLKKAESLGSVNTRVILKDKNEGITLVSLVTTIIILLILAGVTLALISGSDGILGRATHAVDENKKAMAKEQVELAVGDFQTEFFDAKYVERTNDGEKKEYISDKLMAGVETTDFYAVASEDGTVNVYDLGKVESGKEVVIGDIENDGSINWDGKLAEDSNNTSVDLSNYVTKAEYEKAINELNAKIDSLSLEPKTVLGEYRAGTVDFGAIAKGGYKSMSIIFNETLENDNYSITFGLEKAGSGWQNLHYIVWAKTKDGFSMEVASSTAADAGKINWIAVPYN